MKLRIVIEVMLVILLLAPVTALGEEGETESDTVEQTGTIVVSVESLRNCDGYVRVELWASEDGFPRDQEKAFRRVMSAIEGECVEFVFADLTFGEYAVSALHDENGDGKMNMNLFGPEEGYCISNGVRGSIFSGAPGFDDASFILEDEELMLPMEMGY